MKDFKMINDQVMPSIRAVQAKPEEAGEAVDLLVQTARWLQSKGSTQWHALLDGKDMHDMEGATRRGDVFLFRDGSRLAGVVMLADKPSAWDRDLWGESGHEGAVYLHRLAISRAYGGTGLGRAILHWARTGIAFPGIDRIRLDCIGDNRQLNETYAKAGFEYKGESGNGFSKYEIHVNV